MRYVTIKHKDFDEVESEYFLLESERDVQMYITNEQGLAFDDLRKSIIKAGNGEDYQYTSSANKYSEQIFKNPAFELDNYMREKSEKFKKYIASGYQIIINSNGGYNFFNEEKHTIIEEEELYSMPSEEKIFLKEGTKRIVLENDPMLDKFSIKYFNEENISYVTYLKDFYDDELESVFKDFKKQGGEIVFVYTTGMDVPQMYEYTKIAKKAGMKNFEFIFAAGMNEDINKFLIDINTDEINLKVINPTKETKKIKTTKKQGNKVA